MSLENEIKELRASIQGLTNALVSMGSQMPQSEVAQIKQEVEAVAEKPAKKPVKKAAEKPAKEKAVEEKVDVPKTHSDLKATCLKMARAAAGNKPKVKAILAEYGAVKASEVANDKIAEVIEKIEAL